jgi:DNA primase
MTEHLPEGAVATTLADLGIEVETQDSDELFAHCPGHQTRTGKVDGNPSWSINAESGIHYCFSCHYKGNLITLIRDIKGSDAALRFRSEYEVHKRALLEEQDFEFPTITTPPTTLPGFRTANFQSESWLEEFVDPPRWALRERRITAIGAKEYGVLWDAGSESWVFPFRDAETDRLLGYQKKAQRTRLFRNRPRTVPKSETFFGWSVAKRSKRIVIVESPLDAVLLADMEAPAIAICGSHMSDAQVELLAERDFDRVYLWLDHDIAGAMETRRLKKVLIEHGVLTESIIAESYPELDSGKDVGELSFATIEAVLDKAGV